MSNAVYSSGVTDPEAAALLDHWFGDPNDAAEVKRRERLWFAADAAQDQALRKRFGALHERAQQGELAHWVQAPGTTLALVLLLDQLTRNLYRSTASAFANDARALAVVQEAMEREFERSLNVVQRVFLYMPFQHSEQLADQRESVRLFETLVEESPGSLRAFVEHSYKHAVGHCELIERFGRFPHRNKLLDRRSTPAERRYLAEGGQRYGQG